MEKSDNNFRQKAGYFLLVWGVLLILEGLELTSLGDPSPGTPYWIVTLIGAVVIVAGIMTLMQPGESRWKDLLACLITGLMGTIGGWIALFGEASSMEATLGFLTSVPHAPSARIAFGVGAILCYLISGYAFRLFWRKSQG